MKKQKEIPWIVNTYVKQNFNPRRLPGLISSLLKSQQCEGSCSIALNSPSVCMMFTNMKLYDQKQIQRQNAVICGFSKKENKQKYSNSKCKLNTLNKSHNGVRNAVTRNISRMKTQNIEIKENSNKFQINLERQVNTLQKNNLSNIIQFINNCYKIFHIFQYRLKDITMFINCLNESIIKIQSNNQKYKSNIKCLQSTISQLENLCSNIISKIKNVKDILEFYGQFIFEQSNNVKTQQTAYQTTRNNDGQSGNFPYYSLKNYAKELNQKLKQIQAKYTAISKQILARNIKYKQNKDLYSNGFNININYTDKLEIDSDILDEQNDNYLCVPNDTKKLFQACGYKYSNNQSQRSILKTSGNHVLAKLADAKNRSKNKRISIQLIAMENGKNGIEIDKADWKMNNKSRFMHRDGINIGSGRTIGTHGLNLNLKKKYKKQVQIGEQEHQQKQQKQQTFRRAMRKNKTISKKQSQLSANNSQKKPIDILNHQQSSKKIQLRNFRRANTYQDRYRTYSNTSISSNQSSRRSSISKSYEKKKKRRTSRKGSGMYQKTRSNSHKNSKKTGSFKNKGKFQVSPSLKKLIDEALDYKKQGKRFIARSGKIIPLEDVEDFNASKKEIQPEKKIQFYTKRNQIKQKSKILNKDKIKAKKQKDGLYNLFNQDLKQNKKQLNQKTKRKYSKINQHKSTRRLGVTLGNQRDFTKMAEDLIKQDDLDKKKSPSQVTSHGGSKRFNISNSRIKYQQDQQKKIPNQKNKIRPLIQTNKQYCNAPTQFKVNFHELKNFNEQFVKFYPHIQCTLYKTTKRYMKSNDYLNNLPRQENKLLQFAPIPNFFVKKCVHQQNSNHIKQLSIKKKIFDQQNDKLNFSKRLITAINQLEQKEMTQWGNSRRLQRYQYPYTPQNKTNILDDNYCTFRSVF